MKTIKIQVGHSCNNCRFRVEKNNSPYCVAFLKALYMNEKGDYIPVSDCKEDKIKDDE